MTNSQYWQPVRWQPQQELANGKYVILGVLGGGGFGSAYKATEKKTGKTVAIKTLNLLQQDNKTLDQFEELQLKFENEALRLARCNHPHVVRVYELVRSQGLKGMVMEYIKGKNLAEIVEDSGPMSFQEAFRIIEQIGSALTRVHENELLHRDIKPQNIMLRRPGGKAVLIDFGLARSFLPGRTDSITDLGTVCYAPIEQYSRHGVFGPYTDVYALAATLYYLRTGERPIPANFRQEKVPLTEPKQHNSQIPDWENEAILQGLQLQPANRPQTVAAWLKLFAQANSLQLQTFEFTVVTVNDRGREIDRQRRSAEFFAEDLGNGVFLEMVSIPGGSFLMGSPDGEKGRSDSEGPQHRVTVPGFFMGKYPVTQAQYRAVMGDNPS